MCARRSILKYHSIGIMSTLSVYSSRFPYWRSLLWFPLFYPVCIYPRVLLPGLDFRRFDSGSLLSSFIREHTHIPFGSDRGMKAFVASKLLLRTHTHEQMVKAKERRNVRWREEIREGKETNEGQVKETDGEMCGGSSKRERTSLYSRD